MPARNTTLLEMEYDNYSAWGRHSPWIIRLSISLGLFIASIILIAISASYTYEPEHQGLLLLYAAMAFVALGMSLFFLLTGLGKIRLAWRAYRRSGGHFTRSEKMINEERQNLLSTQFAAAELAEHLLENSWRPMQPDWSIILQPGEKAITGGVAHYARFYGMDVSYNQSSAFFMGRPSFVAVGLAATALGNASRRRQAIAMAQAQWREQQVVQTLVTTHRILCQRSDGSWLSFYYSGVTNIDADTGTGTLILQFPDAEPLMLGGPGGMFSAVVAVWALHGHEGLRSYPGLQRLRMLGT